MKSVSQSFLCHHVLSRLHFLFPLDDVAAIPEFSTNSRPIEQQYNCSKQALNTTNDVSLRVGLIAAYSPLVDSEKQNEDNQASCRSRNKRHH